MTTRAERLFQQMPMDQRELLAQYEAELRNEGVDFITIPIWHLYALVKLARGQTP